MEELRAGWNVCKDFEFRHAAVEKFFGLLVMTLQKFPRLTIPGTLKGEWFTSAVRHNYLDATQRLMITGVSTNLKNELLVYAITHNQVKIAKSLLAEGAQMDSIISPILLAYKRDASDMLLFLLQQGIVIDEAIDRDIRDVRVQSIWNTDCDLVYDHWRTYHVDIPRSPDDTVHWMRMVKLCLLGANNCFSYFSHAIDFKRRCLLQTQRVAGERLLTIYSMLQISKEPEGLSLLKKQDDSRRVLQILDREISVPLKVLNAYFQGISVLVELTKTYLWIL